MLLGGIRKKPLKIPVIFRRAVRQPAKNWRKSFHSTFPMSQRVAMQYPCDRSKQLLANKKRELNQELKNLRNRKNQQIHNLTVEKELLEQDCRGLQNNIEDAEREITRLKQIQVEEISENERTAGEKAQEPVQTKKGRISIGVLGTIAAIILNGILCEILHYPVPVVVVTELLFSVAGRWRH